ncbi:MAG TPA: MFS transporter [Candidatus Baltobacteraceae bacterium]|nr:MFS transporter [Candidatus Baltobacteraceae bacterium]
MAVRHVKGHGPAPSHPGSRVHYAWVVLAVTFVCLLAAAAVRSLPGILTHSLETEFGWNRAAIGLAVSINVLLFGLAGPLLGRVMDRVGPRAVAGAATLLIAAGAAGTLGMRHPWQMDILWGLVVGIGSGGATMVMGSAVANRWFRTHRGLALGILGAATSAGQIVFTPTLMQITLRWGWRGSTLVMAGLVGLVVFPLVMLFLRNRPADMGLQPYGASASADIGLPPAPDPHPMRAALRTSDFWLLAGSFAICGFTTSGLIQTHLIPHGTEHGLSEMTMAAALGVMGAADVVGTIASGWICDRFGPRGPLAFYYLFRGISLLLLPLIHTPGTMLAFAVLYGLNWISTVPPTAALAADRFGRQNVGTVFGWIFCAHQVGAALAAYGAGLLHVWLGNYTLSFLLAGGLALVGAGLAFGIRRPVHRQPRRDGAIATGTELTT